jgi:hypothetical protein
VAAPNDAGDLRIDLAEGRREPDLRLHPHPQRADESWPPRRTIHDRQSLESPPHLASAGPADLVAVISARACGAIAGADVFTPEILTWRGLVTYDTVFVIDRESCRVHVVGPTRRPHDPFMPQAVRAAVRQPELTNG